MASKPEIKLNDWITIGEEGRVEAVICKIYERKSVKGRDAEVVYLDDLDRAINEDVKWAETHWKIAIDGPCGGYADKYSRLNGFVSTLRQGRIIDPG